MRVLIVADNALAAESIRRGLRYVPSCQVLGYVDARRPCAETVAQAGPDVVVFAGTSPGPGGLDCIAEIRRAVPAAKLVLLTADMDADRLAEASAAGIDAAIAQSANAASAATLLREIAAGNVFHAFKRVAAAPRNACAAGELTARELEILRLMAGGSSNGSIAAQLWVTEQTVKFHLSNMYRKLGVANRTQASHYAHVHGLLEPVAGEAGAAAVAA